MVGLCGQSSVITLFLFESDSISFSVESRLDDNVLCHLCIERQTKMTVQKLHEAVQNNVHNSNQL